jgi:hypothetical protein
MVNKSHILVFATFAALLASVFFASAVLFNFGGNVANPDTFYTPYETWVNVSVNATITGPGESILSVKANFSAINTTACDGDGYLNLSYVNGYWIGGCSVASFFTNTSQVTPITGGISFVVENSTTNYSSLQQYGSNSITIVMHNLGVPTMGASGVRFGSGTTNLSTTGINFNFVDLSFDVEGNLSYLTNGAVNLPVYQDIFLANFTNLDLSNPATASALAQFGNAISVAINSPRAFGDSRIYINTTLIATLNKSATLKFFNLPFASAPNISTDSGAAGVNGSITWESNGFVTAFNTTTGNLTFSVFGFSGYNITDNVIPAVSIITPGTAKNLTTFMLNVSINGTGTELSKVVINITNSSGQVNSTLYNSTTNTANCNATTAGGEFYYCTYNITLVQGNYTINATAWDYGGSSGNVKSLSQALSVDTTAPVISLSFAHPSNTAFNITITATESGSGISGSCTSSRGTVSGSGTTQYVYASGLDCETSYSFTIGCTDAAGNLGNRTESHTTSTCDSDSGDGGAATTSFWTNSYSPTTAQIQEGFSKGLKKGERVRVKIGTESHYVGIIKLTSTSATINVSSTPQQAVFSVGETKSFEVTEDDYYDIKVKLNSVNSTMANVTVWSVYEKMPAGATTGATTGTTTGAGNESVTTGATEGTAFFSSTVKSYWFWIGLGVVVIIIVGTWYYLRRRKRIKGY